MRKRCPECGQPVKEDNLGEHVARVHPAIPRRRYAEMKIRRPRSARRGTPLWLPLATVLVVLAVAGALYIATLRPTTPSGGPPSFSADHTFYNFGHVEQVTVEHAFPIRNGGPGDLKVWGLQSSCDCTSAHIVIGGVEGPHFDMHNTPDWVGTVPPLTSASLVVVYDAVQMPDLYDGQRSVYLRTSDGAKSEVTFVIQVHESPP